jgi:DNA-binding SARP family transcriptional activator/TolB-like protein
LSAEVGIKPPRAEWDVQSRIHLELIGGFRLLIDGQPQRIKNRKAQALIAYLALAPGLSESRERLAGLLWSESSEEKARASLRQTLHDLRVVLDPQDIGLVAFAHAEIVLDPKLLAVDVWDLLQVHAQGAVSPHFFKEKRLADSLLVGFEDLDPSFRLWLLVQRQSLHERMTRLLEQKIGMDHVAANDRRLYAEALLNLDPTHEGACQFLMLHFAERGDTVSALRIYKALWELLDEEYEIEPSRKTQELVAQLKMGEIKEAADLSPRVMPLNLPLSPAVAIDPTPLLIIVKSFVNDGVTDDKLHIVEGFRHELIASLVRFRELAVFEDSEGTGGDPRIKESATGVAIEGRAFAEDGSLYLTLMLRERVTRRFLWSTRQRLSLERWYESQQSVIRQLAGILKIQISQERMTRIAKLPAVDVDIFDRWLVAQDLQLRWRPQEEMFRGIILEAPAFGSAYSSLTQIINVRHIVFPGVMRSKELEREALEAATKAVQIDPFDSRAQLCLAWVHTFNGDFTSAVLSFQLARELNDSDPWTLVSTAQGLAFCGEQEDADKLANEVLQFGFGASPLNWSYLVGIRFLAGNYAGSVVAAQHANDAILNLRAWKAAALAHLGRLDDARSEAALFLDLIGKNWFGKPNPSPADITAWFLHCFPISNGSAIETLRDGLAKAGLPVDGSTSSSIRAVA